MEIAAARGKAENGAPHVPLDRRRTERRDRRRDRRGATSPHARAIRPRDGRERGARAALPFGPLDPAGHRTLELGLRSWVREQAGLELGYVEQLYTFADRHRDPRERAGGPRMVSIAYLALVREGRVAGAGQARWRGFYEFLPWEDARAGRPALVEKVIVPALEVWVRQAREAETRRARRKRADITFGLRGAALDPVRVLERYELLYESGLASEAGRDHGDGTGSDAAVPPLGEPMALDHRRLMADPAGAAARQAEVPARGVRAPSRHFHPAAPAARGGSAGGRRASTSRTSGASSRWVASSRARASSNRAPWAGRRSCSASDARSCASAAPPGSAGPTRR